MNSTSRFSKLIFRCSAFLLVSSLLVLSSCRKDAKSTSAQGDAANDLREASDISAVASKIDTGGLVAWYNFDSGSLRDLSAYHNRIIFNNAVPTTDRDSRAGNAYYFNGSSSYMEIKNSPSLNPDKEITLFAIVKFDDFYEGKCHGNRILFKGYDDFDPGVYYLGTSDGYYTDQGNCSQPVDKDHQSFEARFGNTSGMDTTAFVARDHWYHLVYTYGRGTTKYYVDGKLVFSTPQRIIPAYNSYNLYLGTMNKFNTQYPYWFHGSIDQVAIFNRALNDNQVARLSAF